MELIFTLIVINSRLKAINERNIKVLFARIYNNKAFISLIVMFLRYIFIIYLDDSLLTCVIFSFLEDVFDF